jgi:hypothetical protein
LAQQMFCPDGCAADGCVQDSTTAGLRCQVCSGNLLVNKVNGNCACPPGTYASAANTCKDCPRASYCPGDDYSYNAVAGAVIGPNAVSQGPCTGGESSSWRVRPDSSVPGQASPPPRLASPAS